MEGYEKKTLESFFKPMYGQVGVTKGRNDFSTGFFSDRKRFLEMAWLSYPTYKPC